jgi:alkylated DNA repair dioxygenase AlkB
MLKLDYERNYLSNLGICPDGLFQELMASPHWFFPTSYLNKTKRAQMYVSDVVPKAGNFSLKPGMAYYNVHSTVSWQNLPPALTRIRQDLNSQYTCDFTFLSLLRYDDDSIGIQAHQDQQDESDWNFPIATVSLGAQREFWYAKIADYQKEYQRLRKKFEKKYAKSTAKSKAKAATPRNVGEILTPEKGSLLIMPAHFQEDHFHAILKAAKERGEPRISLTFRVLPGKEDRSIELHETETAH